MDTNLQEYSHLIGLAEVALHTNGVVALSYASAAAAESISVVDQQVAAIDHLQIPGGFEGAAQMQAGLATMRDTANGWPAVRSQIVAAAQATIAAGPIAAGLGTGDATPAQIAADVNKFSVSVLRPLVAQFAAAKSAFDAFDSAMGNAYSASVNASQAAADAITRSRLSLDNEIKNLQSEEASLSSAGSIISGIFSFGISYAVELHKLQEEEGQLRDHEQQLAYQQACYQNALGFFKNALDAVKLANYALMTLSTALQQSVNSVDDIGASTNPNPVVMNALLQQFKTEFAQAVVNVQKLVA